MNLGLVPTSSGSWKAACQALNTTTGGWLHIHENIDSGPNITGMCTCLGKDACIVRTKHKDSLSDKKTSVWCSFIKMTLETLKSHFCSLYTTKRWKVELAHVEHVKSYAPHVDHVVLDVECRPDFT